MQVSAVILAGGRSRRMGRDKAWLRFEGKSLLERAVETVRTLGLEEIFISGRGDQDYSAFQCPVLLDAESGLGPISGIEAAMRETHSGLLLVLPVDLPRMRPDCLQKLLHACAPLTGAVPELRGQIEPLVAVYPKRSHEQLITNIARGQYAITQFASDCLRKQAVRVFQVPTSDAACFANCNTPEDFVRL